LIATKLDLLENKLENNFDELKERINLINKSKKKNLIFYLLKKKKIINFSYQKLSDRK
jgi:uncharacterized protein YjgD (DUF1641 family)